MSESNKICAQFNEDKDILTCELAYKAGYYMGVAHKFLVNCMNFSATFLLPTISIIYGFQALNALGAYINIRHSNAEGVQEGDARKYFNEFMFKGFAGVSLITFYNLDISNNEVKDVKKASSSHCGESCVDYYGKKFVDYVMGEGGASSSDNENS